MMDNIAGRIMLIKLRGGRRKKMIFNIEDNKDGETEDLQTRENRDGEQTVEQVVVIIIVRGMIAIVIIKAGATAAVGGNKEQETGIKDGKKTDRVVVMIFRVVREVMRMGKEVVIMIAVPTVVGKRAGRIRKVEGGKTGERKNRGKGQEKQRKPVVGLLRVLLGAGSFQR